MTGKNMPASVKQRLLNLSRNTGEDFQLDLTRYAVERLLAGLSRSENREAFARDDGKQTQWMAFLNGSGLEAALSLEDVVAQIGQFLSVPLRHAARGERFGRAWAPGRGWNELRSSPDWPQAGTSR